MSDCGILNDEERLLIKKAEDKLRLCVSRYSLTFTGFLNEREQDILLSHLTVDADAQTELIGGYSEADRRIMLFYPEYLDPSEEKSPLTAVRASYYKDYTLSHRDILGALMGLGISRESVGDILVDAERHSADIIIKTEIRDFILTEFASAGRAKLSVKEIPLSELNVPKCETEEITDTVASPRIDAVASSGFGISRESAASLIKSGRLYLNRRLCTEPDRTVADASVITATGYGKFKVGVSDRVSKKGRIFIRIERYK